jgi:hypothetical protein
MSEKKNYNINTLRGVTNDDDAEVCRVLGLNPELAYTPEMVQAQLDRDVAPELHKEILKDLKKFM